MSDVPAVILGSESHFGNRGVGLRVVQGQVGDTTDFRTDNSIICGCKYVCDRMCVQNYVHLTLVKSNLGQKKNKKLSRYVGVRDFPLNSANIAAEILHVHGVILILT